MSIQDIAEHLEEMEIGLDDTFRFHCTCCGKCCVDREDILLPPRDVYRLAKELNLDPVSFFHQYCETYIGGNSRIPIVRLKPVGNAKRCPLLHKRKCMVHHAKPSVCALYPLGRFLEVKKQDGQDKLPEPKIRYLLQPCDCGDRSEEHTVRQWLSNFDISLEDQVFLRWNQMVASVGPRLKNIEANVGPFLMTKVWSAFLAVMYLNYDTSEDFLPQFDENAGKIREILEKVEKGDLKDGK